MLKYRIKLHPAIVKRNSTKSSNNIYILLSLDSEMGFTMVLRDLEIAKISTDSLKFKKMQEDFYASNSKLKPTLSAVPHSFTELSLYSLVLEKIIFFLSKKKAEIIREYNHTNNKEDVGDALSKVLKETIPIYILVHDSEAKVYTPNQELLDYLRRKVIKAGYQFRTVSLEECKTWWKHESN